MAGVDSISAQGEPQLTGHVTVSEGSGITLTQVGQDIEISAAAAAPVTGMEAWYSAADVSSLTITSNKVSQWDDLSGNGHDLTQANAALRPLYDGTPREINGIVVPEWTAGAAESMASTCPMDDRTATLFAVVLPDNITNAKCLAGDTQGGGWEIRVQAVVSHLKSGVAVLATSSLAYAAGIPTIYCSQMSATDHFFRWPGDVENTTAEGTTFTAGRTLKLGCDQSDTIVWDGLIAEVIIYLSTLSDADVSQNFRYLASQWY
jgi:hypothetical protein